MECPDCGFPIEDKNLKACPKCGQAVKNIFVNKLHQVDIAHQGETWEEAKKKLDEALHFCKREHYKGLRVIHGGGGAAGHTGIIKQRAVEYLLKRIKRFNATLESDSQNPGMHTVYFKRSRNA